jgi:uncharacterized protein (TIGR00251 family)
VTSKNSPQRNKGAMSSATFSIRIQPRASKNEIVLMEGGGFKIRLTAPPVDNAANEALIRFLADTFSVPRSQIEIVSGLASKNKIVRMEGISSEAVNQHLSGKGK